MKDLPGKLIFKGIVGSQAYNLSTPTSDIDYKGVYVQSLDDILKGNYIPFYEVNDDDVYYELNHYLDLLQNANPNILELLYLPDNCIEYTSDIWQELIKIREQFITKQCKMSYSGYARTQIKKASGLDKKTKWEKSRVERKNIGDFCYVIDRDTGKQQTFNKYKEQFAEQMNFGLAKVDHHNETYKLYASTEYKYRGVYKEDSNEVRLSEIPKIENNNWTGTLFFNIPAYTRHCKDYISYKKWQESRNVNRYKTNKEHGQVYDSKNIMHCLRLIQIAYEIPTDNSINVVRHNREELLNIKQGNVDLQEILNKCNSMLEEMDTLYENSSLPEFTPKEVKENLLLKLRKKFYNLK